MSEKSPGEFPISRGRGVLPSSNIQHPTSNIRRRSKSQGPITNKRRETFGAWILMFLWMLEVGGWMLMQGLTPRPRSSLLHSLRFGLKVAGADDREFFWIDMFLQSSLHLCRRQGFDLFLQLSFKGHGPPDVPQIRDQSDHGDVAGPANFSSLQITLFC